MWGHNQICRGVNTPDFLDVRIGRPTRSPAIKPLKEAGRLLGPNEDDRYIARLPASATHALASLRRQLALSRRWGGPHRHKVSKVHSPASAALVLLDRIDALVLLLAVLVEVLAILDPALAGRTTLTESNVGAVSPRPSTQRIFSESQCRCMTSAARCFVSKSAGFFCPRTVR